MEKNIHIFQVTKRRKKPGQQYVNSGIGLVAASLRIIVDWETCIIIVIFVIIVDWVTTLNLASVASLTRQTHLMGKDDVSKSLFNVNLRR